MDKIKNWAALAGLGVIIYLVLLFRGRTKKLRALQFKVQTAKYSRELEGIKSLIKKRKVERVELDKKLKVAVSAYMQSSKRLKDSSSG